MRVCKAWHAVASVLFYAVVQPRTISASIALSNTLASSPTLAAAVRAVEFPQSTMILSSHKMFRDFGTYALTPRMQQRLAHAIDTVIRLAMHADGYRLYSGYSDTATNELADAYAVRTVCSTARYLRLERPKWPASPFPDQRPFRYRGPASDHAALSPDAVIFERLEVLRLADDFHFHFWGPFSRTPCPALRVLLLSHIRMAARDLEHLLAAVHGTLEILSLTDVRLYSDPTVFTRDAQHALQTLDDIAPAGLPRSLKELRLHRAYLRAGDVLTLRNMHRIATITHLAAPFEVMQRLELVPPTLQDLTVYHLPRGPRDYPNTDVSDIRTTRDWLSSADTLRRCVPKWKGCASGLRVVRQRVADAVRDELRDLQIMSFVLGFFCEQWDVRLESELWLARA